MKKNFCMAVLIRFALFAAVCFLTGCATTKNQDSNSKTAETPLLFEDWQYRGFGNGYPKWCEAVLLNKGLEQMEEFFPEVQGRADDLYCLKIGADTVDSCSATLANEELLNTGDKILARTWVKINPYYEQFDFPYYSIILFIKDSQEEIQ